jgi:formate dehydrogenase
MVLYPDPVTRYPPTYARDSIPMINSYPDGSSLPTPSTIDFTPGELLGCVSGALGLQKFFEDGGHELVVTSDKDGPDCEFVRELPDADIVISQPFWPAYLTKERSAKAPNLKPALPPVSARIMWISPKHRPGTSRSLRKPTATASVWPSTR